MFKVGVVGDGYAAAELLRLCAVHEALEVVYISSLDHIGKSISSLYPNLGGCYDLVCQATDLEWIKNHCDAVFLALPHGQSVPIALDLLHAGLLVVDLGADFRLKDPELYRKHYNLEHGAPGMLEQAVYGLPELYREELKKASLAANPGCYPTGAIMPLVPLLADGLIEGSGIIIDSKSGVSGAGRVPKDSTTFCEVNENFAAYAVSGHRHGPEIAQELSFAAGCPVSIRFSPHLVPISRGILTTSYSRLKAGAGPEEVRRSLLKRYGDEYFVRILPDGQYPGTKWVYGSNFIHMNFWVDDENGLLIMVSAIDNLCKGAAGQAIQCLNLMLGLPETSGLRQLGVFP